MIDTIIKPSLGGKRVPDVDKADIEGLHGRMGETPYRPPADPLIIDEAHHCRVRSYRSQLPEQLRSSRRALTCRTTSSSESPTRLPETAERTSRAV